MASHKPQPPKDASPAVMTGRKDPALSVRPVDYRAATRDHARRLAEGTTERSDGASSPTPRPATEPSGTGRADRGRAVAQRADLARRIKAALEANANRALAPEDSLYSVVSGTPVPTGDHVRLSTPPENVHVVDAWDVTLADLQHVVESPEDTWSADMGRTDHFVRGQLCVQIRRIDAQVVGIYRADWALARRPDIPTDDPAAIHPNTLSPQAPGSGRSASRGRGTRYPTNQRELLRRLRAAGFDVVTSGPTHGKITHPDHPGLFLPYSSTPSGQRYGRHVVTAVKRVFGIDLRE